MLYNEIQKLRSQGFSKSQIARKLNVSRNTVIDYEKMSPEQFYEFAISLQTRKFKIYLCRKSDPQSKGEIEQVVKYVKNNFSKNRVFDNPLDWQESCMKWLKRTGNNKVHHNTKKRPDEVHALEKQHLQKISGTYIFEKVFTDSITRSIQKDNVIRFEGNLYSVPLGTYRDGAANMAYVEKDEEYLYIRLQRNGQVLAKHLIASGRGSLISDPVHRERNHTKRNLLIQQIEDSINDNETAKWLIEVLTMHYPRHLVDQLRIVQAVILNYPSLINEAISEMKRLKLTSANELRDIAHSIEIQSKKRPSSVGIINEKYIDFVAPERKDDIYIRVLQGSGRG